MLFWGRPPSSLLVHLNLSCLPPWFPCFFFTPIEHSLLISVIKVALCTCATGYGLPWYGLASSFNSIEMGGGFQLPRVPSKSVSYLSSNESSFSLCDGCRWGQLSRTMTGRSALSYLASSIAMTLLASFRVLSGSWAWQVLCLNALVTLGLSCRLTIFLMGRRILSIVMVLFLKSRTVPMSCKLCLPIIRSYRGSLAPGSYSTISGVRYTDLLMEYSAKEMSISPTFLVWKVPLEVPHDCGAALFAYDMYFWDPFLMKRRSPLDPVSSSTLIVFFLTISPSLASLTGPSSPIWCNLALFWCFFFKFRRLFDLIDFFRN